MFSLFRSILAAIYNVFCSSGQLLLLFTMFFTLQVNFGCCLQCFSLFMCILAAVYNVFRSSCAFLVLFTMFLLLSSEALLGNRFLEAGKPGRLLCSFFNQNLYLEIGFWRPGGLEAFVLIFLIKTLTWKFVFRSLRPGRLLCSLF